MINLDPFSIVVTVLYIFILYVFMSRFFFAPILRILHDRKQLIEGRLAAAASRIAQVDQKAAEYEQTIRAARSEAYRKQETLREQALAERAALVTKAKAEAERTVQTTRTNLLKQSDSAIQRLEAEADLLADDLAGVLLKD